MRRTLATACACAVIAATAIACEKITHVADFEPGPVPEPDAGPDTGPSQDTPADEICRRCPGGDTNLRHPPCPTEGSGDDGQVYVYAWKSLQLGFQADPMKTLDPNFYNDRVGYDFDCSSRAPDGLPATCAAIIPDAGPEAETPWKVYPRGIDNALSQRFLAPLYLGALKADPNTLPLDRTFSEQLVKGHGSILTIVYGWNGTPDDKKVSVRIVSAKRLVGAEVDTNKIPAWDGNDKWIAATAQSDPDLRSDQIPLVNSKTDDAYVAGGVLVVDYSFLKPLKNRIVNAGVALEVPLYDMHMVANITKEKLEYEQFFGRWPLAELQAKSDDVAQFLAACDQAKLFALKRALPGLSSSAADVFYDTNPTGPACDALSVTWAADAFRASIGGYEAFSNVVTPCP